MRRLHVCVPQFRWRRQSLVCAPPRPGAATAKEQEAWVGTPRSISPPKLGCLLGTSWTATSTRWTPPIERHRQSATRLVDSRVWKISLCQLIFLGLRHRRKGAWYLTKHLLSHEQLLLLWTTTVHILTPLLPVRTFLWSEGATDFALSTTGDVLDLFTACSFTSALILAFVFPFELLFLWNLF